MKKKYDHWIEELEIFLNNIFKDMKRMQENDQEMQVSDMRRWVSTHVCSFKWQLTCAQNAQASMSQEIHESME